MDFPAETATLNRRRRIDRMRCKRSSGSDVPASSMQPLDRAHVEELKGL